MKIKSKAHVFMPGRVVKRYVTIKVLDNGDERVTWNGPENFKTPDGRQKLYAGRIVNDQFVFEDKMDESMFRRFYKQKRFSYPKRTLTAINDRINAHNIKYRNTPEGIAAREAFEKKEYPFEQ